MLIALLAIYAVVIVGVLIVYVWSRKQTVTLGLATAEEKIAKAATAQDFIPFDSISDGVVKLDPNRFRAYLDVEPVNFYYLTAGEQATLEANFRHFLDGLRYPVQICVTSVPLDLSDHLNALEQEQPDLPPRLNAYKRELAAMTREWIERYAPITKRYTVVVCYDYEPNPHKPIRPEIVELQARVELDQRCRHIAESLGRAGFVVRRLDDREIAAFFYQVLNRHKGAEAAARHLWDADLTSVYVRRAQGEEVLSGGRVRSAS